MKFSLFRKIGLSFLLATVIPVALFFYFGGNFATNISTQEISAKNKLASYQASNYVDLFMLNANNVLRNISNDDSFHGGSDEDMIKALGMYGHDFVINGEQIFETMVLLDKNGLVKTVYPFKENYIGLDYSHFDYYQKIISGDERYTSSDVWISPITNKPIMEMALPIKNDQGEVSFIVAANLNLFSLTELSQKIKTGNTGFAYILDKRGIFIAHPDKENVLQQQNIKNIFPGLFEKMVGEEGNLFWPEKNPQYVVSWYTLPDLGWQVVLSQDYNEAFKSPNTIKWLFVALFVVIFFIILAVSFFVSRFIVNPIKKLGLATKSAAGGELNVRTDIKTGDEIQELGDDFNYMIGEIRDYQDKVDAIVANFTDPIIVLDNEWKIILFNPIAERVLGLTQKNLGNKIVSPGNHFSLNDFKSVIEVKFGVKEIKLDENNNPIIEEVTIKTEEMDLVYKVMTAEVCSDDNKCYGRMKIFYDQTREKNVEKLKTEFVSLAAHQLRTPLAAVKWIFKMIIDGDVGQISSEQKDFLEKGYQSNERVITMVNGLLDVTKIEEGRFLHEFSLISLEDLIEELANRTNQKKQDKHIKINFTKPSVPLPKVEVDAEKMDVVVQNLIDNAINYSSQDGEIKISIENKGKEMEVRVSDQGMGIPENQKERIFTKFFRAGNAVKKETDGTGLGLFICKNIVEMHGGKIGFESEEGKGTTFWFVIPIDHKVNAKINNKLS